MTVVALKSSCLAVVISWRYNFFDLRISARVKVKVEQLVEALRRVRWMISLLVRMGP